MVSPRISVVRLITRLNIGGPAIQAASLTSRLGPAGFDTRLLYGRLDPGEGDMAYALAPGADAIYLPRLRRPIDPPNDLLTVWEVYRELCRVRPAIIHTHTAKAGALGRLAAFAYNRTHGRRAPARVVHTYHGHVFDGYFSQTAARVFVATERALARGTDAIVAISSRIRDDIVTTYRIGRPQQVRVIPLGFELMPFAEIDDLARDEARRRLRIPPATPVVTTVGRLTAIKNHRLFLSAAGRIAQVHPEAVFLIAGDGNLRPDLEAMAREQGLADRVRFLGWRRDLPTIYAATDVFMLTSRNEGTPVALIEAMAAGVPGVSTDVGGVRDVVCSDELGRVVSDATPEALAHAVDTLLRLPDRRAMGERGRRSALARYSVERLVADIAGLYREMLAQAPER